MVLPQAADEFAGLDDLHWVDADGGHVEDEHRGLVEHGLGQPDALPEALGQPPDEGVDVISDGEALDHVVGAALALRRRHLAQAPMKSR